MWTDVSSSFKRLIYGGPRRVVKWFGKQALMVALIWNRWQISSIDINIASVRQQGWIRNGLTLGGLFMFGDQVVANMIPIEVTKMKPSLPKQFD